MEHGGQRVWVKVAAISAAAVMVGFGVWWVIAAFLQRNVQVEDSNKPVPSVSTETPKIKTEEIVSGYDHIWDVAFLPTKEMLFTERKGIVHARKGNITTQLAIIADVYNRGEGGLLGLAVDGAFATNRYIYTCFNSTTGAPDIRVVRWKVSQDVTKLEGRRDIITGIPSNPSGRHSGCRVAFGPDGYLWVGTGDTARGDTSIQPKSLGGKILRVDRDGRAAPGNLGGQYDPRIYSYGHRNVQGLAFFATPRNGILGISVEHGSSVDDEVNLLKSGNFGWAPPAFGYDERVPMTDKTRFPDAISPLWKSGDPTQAPSGAAIIQGSRWKAWDGAVAVAVLKDKHLKIIRIDDQNELLNEDMVLKQQFGRIRAVTQGPEGDLYITTDNGDSDKIIRITPY